MKETGLMFKAPLVRAILEGRKTQTRRIVKGVGHDNCIQVRQPGKTKAGVFSHVMDAPKLGLCPMGQTGDLIYVRETYWAWGRWETRYSEAKGRDEWHFVDLTLECGRLYRFSDPLPGTLRRRGQGGIEPTWWKRPGILMPKTAARIWLEITGVRVERLQQITEADCIAEGAPGGHGAIGGYHYNTTPLEQFRNLWESTGGDWAANPWVWAIDFKTISTTGRPA